MESFIWGPQFETGLVEVDKQHQFLVNLINRFGTLMTEDRVDKEAIDLIFADLTTYAEEHFKDEELMMSSLQIDNKHYTAHITEHKRFLDDVKSMKNSIVFDRPESVQPLLQFLINWLVYHILGSDMNMAHQLKSIEDGASPGDAYTDNETETSNLTELLINALTSLFSLVSKRNSELYELNQTLEKKVMERTKALSRAVDRLKVIARTDHLTALPNRRHALQQFNHLWQESEMLGQPLSCLMVDADGFKKVNDTYGHDAGDIVLKRLAQELSHLVRTDDIACRLGGDEFLILCPNTDLSGALYLAEHIRERVAALEVNTGNGLWHGSVSIGVACKNRETHSVDDLLKASDRSVYAAKSSGRNCVRTKSS